MSTENPLTAVPNPRKMRTRQGLPPELLAWVDNRRAAGHGPVASERYAAHIAAMAGRLKLHPADLPQDAVALHFADRDATPATATSYQKALEMWTHWLRHGIRLRRHDGGDKNAELHSALKDWRDILTDDGLTAKSVGVYLSHVQRLTAHANVEPNALTHGHVRAYLRHLDERAVSRAGDPSAKVSSGYRNHFLTCCQRYGEDMGIDGLIGKLKRTRVDKRQNHTVPADEETLKHLLTCAEQEYRSSRPATHYRGRMMRALIIAMATTGVRISTAKDICPADLEVIRGKNYLRLQTSKGRERLPDGYIMASDALVDEMGNYWSRHETICPADWTAHKAGQMFTGWAIKNHKFIHAHQLRAFYATGLYHETKDMVLVQEQMLHSSMTTTEKYVKLLDDPDRDRIVAKFGGGLVRQLPSHIDKPDNVVRIRPTA